MSCKHSTVMWAVGYTSPTYCRYLRNPFLMDYYSFNRPRRDGWLTWPCWLTDSGRFTHKVVTRPAVSLVQDRESSPVRTGGLTTMLRRQLAVDMAFVGHRRSSKTTPFDRSCVTSHLSCYFSICDRLTVVSCTSHESDCRHTQDAHSVMSVRLLGTLSLTISKTTLSLFILSDASSYNFLCRR